jgi:hypothetical protein
LSGATDDGHPDDQRPCRAAAGIADARVMKNEQPSPTRGSGIGIGAGIGGGIGLVVAVLLAADIPLGLVFGAGIGVILGLLVEGAAAGDSTAR